MHCNTSGKCTLWFPSVYRYFVFILFISSVYCAVYQLKCVGGGYSDGRNIIIVVIIAVVSYELPTSVWNSKRTHKVKIKPVHTIFFLILIVHIIFNGLKKFVWCTFSACFCYVVAAAAASDDGIPLPLSLNTGLYTLMLRNFIFKLLFFFISSRSIFFLYLLLLLLLLLSMRLFLWFVVDVWCSLSLIP